MSNYFKLTILTDNKTSWILKYIEKLKKKIPSNFSIKHVFDSNEIDYGDILLILSCEKILPKKILKLNKHNIVVHPSDLPKGKAFLLWHGKF